MSVTCHIDRTTHDSIDALHAYIKTAFRVSRKEYWTTYEPRKDLCTGEAIPYKDHEQYLSTDFINRITLKRYLKEQPPQVGLDWAKGWLAKRKAAKGLIYAPSQVELRTLCAPTMPWYEKVAAHEGGYYGVTAALGFKSRYVKSCLVYQTLPSGASVIQDSREQNPIKLPLEPLVATLNVGDYALTAPHDQGIRIERKSLPDMIGSLSGKRVARKGGRNGNGVTEDSAYARFDRELARATEQGLHVVMMVEASINDAQRFDYLPQTKWVKASPNYIFHNLRDLLVKYPLSFQVVFCDGRRELADKMMRVFQLGAQVREIDLQHHLEEGLL